nr:response regulator [uncultured Niameybacter sp.]
MYRVLLIDDENYVLKSLTLSIPWESLSLSIAASFNGAQDALNFLEKEPIDIIITDIQMPGFSGLELAKIIHTKYPHIQMIIISGFAHFSYAQTAMRYGVIEYVLKPIDTNELIYCLQKATTHLIKASSIQSNIIHFIEENNEVELKKYLEDQGFSQNQFYVATSINLPALENIPQPYLTFQFGKKKYAYLSPNPYDLQESLTLHLGSLGGIGICASPITVDKLHKTIKECDLKAYQYFMEGQTTLYSTLPSSHPVELIGEVAYYLSKHQTAKLNTLLNQIHTLSLNKELNILFALHLFQLILSSDLLDSKTKIVDYYNFDQLTDEFSCFSHMLTFISTILDESKEPPLQNDYSTNTNFLVILKYINDHFTEPLSLQTLSEQLHMNASYISQLFKKETQTTYIKYLTNLRVNYAKELLDTSTLSVDEVCEQAGFNDYFYFSKVFKKVVSLSPAQYRSRSLSFNNKIS